MHKSELVVEGTVGDMKMVPSVYTLNQQYLFIPSTQVAGGTVFRKHTVE